MPFTKPSRRARLRAAFSVGVALALLVPAALVVGATSVSVSGASAVVKVSVVGKRLVDGSGNTLQLRGVNKSGSEYACVQGWGLFDGPSDAASVRAIAAWKTNVVRLGLNEDCWLGINGVNASYSGANYRTAITNYVNLLNQNGLYAILELHWSAPGTTLATGQNPMPDSDHTPAFWTSVATTFKASHAVIFDLFNEPYPDNNQNTTAAWTCWKNGGTCANVSYPVAGMQTLVNTVRATGATNVIMLGGVQYAGTLSQWGTYAPTDSAGQLAASFHTYDFTSCTTTSCWNSWLTAVGNHPLITGEFGETDGASTYIDSYMAWADTHGVSYLAWVWNTWGCGGSIALITDYNGAACPNYGTSYKTHLAARASIPTPTTKPTKPKPGTPAPGAAAGYWVAGRTGGVWGFGLKTYGNATPVASRSPIVAMGATRDKLGYWLATADGAVYAYGTAHSFGSMLGKPLAAPIVAMAPTTNGQGYWLLAADGGIFSFGNARFYGSTGAMKLAAKVVDLSPTPTGKGYRLVAADGGIFTFGDAKFYGSTGAMHLAAPVRSMATSATGHGYWLVALDGGVFSFGDAGYLGSLPGRGIHRFVARVRANASGKGYWVLSTDGYVYAFGNATGRGSVAGTQTVDIALG